ncbi:hypothetical protein PAHAL_8G168600 [Panicum hallii]|uniref:Uncharacterized protein n=1 Tax=Panicum hallii TaxID=206008 RepID=A0A2T8I938_9POAL|nr:hypothetical protein PAHAL_8G168600 [Panicum hallii]
MLIGPSAFHGVCIYVVLQGIIFIYCMKNEVNELINGMVTRTNKSRVKRMFTEGPVARAQGSRKSSSHPKKINFLFTRHRTNAAEWRWTSTREYSAKSAYKMLHQGPIPLHSHKLISGGPGHL